MTQTNTPPPAKRKKGRKKWLWIAALVVVAAVAYFALSAGSRVQNAYQQEIAARRDISTYYSFSGHLSPVTDKVQTAKEAVKVKELYVKEGDTVAAGQALLRGADGTRVYAVERGVIDELYADPDDQLQIGSQIARIVDYETLEVSVDVDEYDISALALGKQGTVYLNALDKSVAGTVRDIARDATTDGGVSYYAVKLEIDAAQDIRSGMSVEVNVLNRRALGAVSISNKALAYDEYNKPYVLVRDQDDVISVRDVTLGVSDGLYTEVAEGLGENETVYYMPDNMTRFFMMGQNMNALRNR